MKETPHRLEYSSTEMEEEELTDYQGVIAGMLDISAPGLAGTSSVTDYRTYTPLSASHATLRTELAMKQQASHRSERSSS